MKFRTATLLALGLFAPLAHGAEGAGAKADPAKGQQTATTICAACHGPDGNSPASVNPNLAGQHAAYISKQLHDFKAAKERNNAIMAGMVAALSEEDMKNVAAYFASQPPKPGTAANPDLANAGARIYRGGVRATGVPACAACHGADGAGMPAQYPRLAGQYADYTVAQLKAFRAGERANDPNAMMREIALRMTDKEIQAVAEFISGLR